MTQETKPVIAILSIGDMGLGIASLLISHEYRVVTYAEDRSTRTRDRARSSGVELLPSISDLCKQSDCILSIVPPRDALATAKRVSGAISTEQPLNRPLYYIDLNSVSPGLSNDLDALLRGNEDIILIDGGIIGGVPYLKSDSPPQWNCPSLIVSGPVKLPYQDIVEKLNIEHISPRIGAASGLKLCFGSMTKGFFSLAIQSFVTADTLGVLPDLRHYMQRYNSETLAIADKGIVGMPPKAYRWVYEMQQIGAMMKENGGFDSGLFDGVAEVYRVVAEDTELGREQPGRRKRGTTVEDVVDLMRLGMQAARHPE